MNCDSVKENPSPATPPDEVIPPGGKPDTSPPEGQDKLKRGQKLKKLEEELRLQLEENERLIESVNACKEQLLRAAAEFDNFRKRSLKEREALFSMVAGETVAAFLPMIDNFERALQTPVGEGGESYKKGYELIYKQLEEILAALGVERICPEGEPFDPETCNAVMHVEDEAYGANTVCEVLGPGYRIGARVIRHAMVKVAN